MRNVLAGLVCSALLLAAPVSALCPTDCNGNGEVTVDEIIRGVSVALGEGRYRTCPPGDVDTDGDVTVDELLQGVHGALHGCPATVSMYRAPERVRPTGPTGERDGYAVLPNGRLLQPAGRQVGAETLPLTLALTADGKSLIVTNDGYGDDDNRQFLQVIDTETLEVTRTEVPHFMGLAMTPDGSHVYVGNDRSGKDRVESLALADGTLTRGAPLAELDNFDYPSGLALSPDATHVYILGLLSNSFVSVDTATGEQHPADVPVGNYPYGVVISPDGKRAYVTSWGVNNGNPDDLVPEPLPPVETTRPQRSSLAVIDTSDPNSPRLLRYVRVAPSMRPDNISTFGATHPSAMALSPDGNYLYVTATNVDILVVFDAHTLATVAEVPLNVFDSKPARDQLQGLYPNGLAISPDGRRLYVADAGINAVQVIDANPATASFRTLGFIPTGYYPTAVTLSPDGTRLYVANGKGQAFGPNGGPEFDALNSPTTYIAQLVKGSVSIIDDVQDFDLAAGTRKIIDLAGFDPVEVAWTDGEPGPNEVQRRNPIPIEVGSGPSDEITHVVFIMKENRTYDQIFGEYEKGDGAADLAYFGGDITPNHTAIAREFALGDNFYDDGEVSTPGHEWIDQANCTDWTEKIWPSNYDRAIPSGVLEQGLEGFTKSGFIWERLAREGVPYRVFGETLSILSRFASGIDGKGIASIAIPLVNAFGHFPTPSQVFKIINGELGDLEAEGVNVTAIENDLFPHNNLRYASNILANRSDQERAAIFKSELAKYEAAGSMPNYVQIWLPNDHTFGASPGNPTPRGAVADNDEGLGLVIEALTHSSFWPHMAIFVTEDDAQDGQDHVSAYRTVGMVISPYVKRGYVSHVHHSNVSMMKTMELILGVPPLSTYDRHATDMRDYFTSNPDLTPYDARPRIIPRDDVFPRNTLAANAYFRQAAAISEDLDFDLYDEAGAGLSRVITLMHLGQIAEDQAAVADWVTCASVLLLISIASTRMWRRQGTAES